MIVNVAAYPTGIYDILGLWAGLLLMIFIYSYPLFKENAAYRFAEHTFLATALAIGLIVTLQSLQQVIVAPIMAGQYIIFIPIILGFVMYTLLIPSKRWLSRYPIAILVGSTIGLSLASGIQPNIISQIISTITTPAAGAQAVDWFTFIWVAIGTFCATAYFILTYEHTSVVKPVTQLGRYFIMIGLGAYFGNTVLFRFSMLATRAQFFLQVLKIIPM